MTLYALGALALLTGNAQGRTVVFIVVPSPQDAVNPQDPVKPQDQKPHGPAPVFEGEEKVALDRALNRLRSDVADARQENKPIANTPQTRRSIENIGEIASLSLRRYIGDERADVRIEDLWVDITDDRMKVLMGFRGGDDRFKTLFDPLSTDFKLSEPEASSLATRRLFDNDPASTPAAERWFLTTDIDSFTRRDSPICPPASLDWRDAFADESGRALDRTFGDLTSTTIDTLRTFEEWSDTPFFLARSDRFAHKLDKMGHRIEIALRRHPKFGGINLQDPQSLEQMDAQDRQDLAEWIGKRALKESESIVSDVLQPGAEDYDDLFKNSSIFSVFRFQTSHFRSNEENRRYTGNNEGLISVVDGRRIEPVRRIGDLFDAMTAWIPGDLGADVKGRFDNVRVTVSWEPFAKEVPLGIEFQREQRFFDDEHENRIRAVFSTHSGQGGWLSIPNSRLGIVAETLAVEGEERDYRLAIQYQVIF